MPLAALRLHEAGSSVYMQGDAADGLYQVAFGTIRICRIATDGRRQITGFLMAGDVFGFEAGRVHESSAESTEDAGVRKLPTANADEASKHLLRIALSTLARTQRQLVLLGCRSANARMASFLVDLSERQGSRRRIHLPMQRNDIADYLGITFETVSRTLRFLKDRRVIRLLATSDIEVLDQVELESLCE